MFILCNIYGHIYYKHVERSVFINQLFKRIMAPSFMVA